MGSDNIVKKGRTAATDEQQVGRLFADERLWTLAEQLRHSDGLYNVINMIGMLEHQHSRMLSWCLSPNEGHGQGDAMLKDLLIAAHGASEGTDGRTADFFGQWTPARVRTSGFGAAFVQREVPVRGLETLKVRKQGHSGRLDLLIIDPQNRLMVVIENKYGSRLGQDQLRKYRDLVDQQILGTGEYKGYHCAFVVMDMYNTHERGESDSADEWAFIDYSWLRSAGDRARLQADHHTEGAKLLMAYCAAQTQWQSDTSEKVSELAAAIVNDHEATVERMRILSGMPFAQWPPSSDGLSDRQLLHFTKQQPQVVEALVPMLGIAMVRGLIRKERPDITESQLWGGPKSLWIVSPLLEGWLEEGGHWPLYLNVFRHHADSVEAGNESVFYMTAHWNAALWPESYRHAELVARIKQLCSGRGVRKSGGVYPEKLLIDKWTSCNAGGEGGWVGNAQEAAAKACALLERIDQQIGAFEARRTEPGVKGR